MNISAELELAATHLLRARELAEFFQRPKEQIERLDLLKRAVIKTRTEMKESL